MDRIAERRGRPECVARRIQFRPSVDSRAVGRDSQRCHTERSDIEVASTTAPVMRLRAERR